VWVEDPSGNQIATDDLAITQAITMIKAGKILAVKGIGGFHLACDAENPDAVQELRRRKLRVDKPFAVMMPDLKVVEDHCSLSQEETSALLSRERPIVLLSRLPTSTISHAAAPGQNTLGVMLPYTPLHYLLFSQVQGREKVFHPAQSLVMTSGNLSEEPIAASNEEARERLSSLADAFLFHDRPIHIRCDDSVIRIHQPSVEKSTPKKNNIQGYYPIRRSRGFSPSPVRILWDTPPILGCGGELKNTFCLTNGRYAFLSHHIGDLENYETLTSYEEGITHFEHLFRVKPTLLVHDLHPDYLSTRYAQNRAAEQGLPILGVQHHHAHIAACMTENQIESEQPVLGFSFDGTGYGEDGAIWGGEVLLSTYKSFSRSAHLDYVPLIGGEKAIREPWRMALAWLIKANIELSPDLPPVQMMLSKGIQFETVLTLFHRRSTETSSIGRLFDAVASLIGIRQEVNYEGQAAIELEAKTAKQEYPSYLFKLIEPDQHTSSIRIDPCPMLHEIVEDFRNGCSKNIIASRFHHTVKEIVLHTSRRVLPDDKPFAIALSGGVWQNMILLQITQKALEQAGFSVITHHVVPANDGGISLGQIAVAVHKNIRAF
jgi:hydrogenase maturation protein HypF